MNRVSSQLKFFIDLSKAKTVAARRFDNRLSFHGLGLSDFLILFHLSTAPEEKLRRVDLAEKVGLTASGVTRLLLPMEKIGLVRREAYEQDARVSFVTLAPGGNRRFTECLEDVEVLARDILKDANPKGKRLDEFSDLLVELGKIAVY
jgi:DNA-binding MarR family transcriptional regulator